MSENETNKNQYDLDIMDRAVEILTAFLSNPTTRIEYAQIPDAYKKVRDALKEDFAPSKFAAEEIDNKPVPAISVRKSVTEEVIYCLECGKPFKSMKRHLNQNHGISVEEYREKWNLPRDYPMVAASYSKQRSDLAKNLNLGEAIRKKQPA